MRQIAPLYFNDFGTAFYWKKDGEILMDKVQVVFKETGFHFNEIELETFAKLIDETCRKNTCDGCGMRHHCMKFLLKTPVSQVDLAVSPYELAEIKDLVQGTLFRMRLQKFVFGIGRN
ncbi:hypothetical protein [Flavobacterium selenitireducens]|uniref:hypothetical protein n=1 Tax=Flavobacterium selenitireducens TaxID=2722704 RepID=UPI00168BC5F9|nr:hypothetical protein [Flavobacterium selenitireducens]MBD3582249.1 hypothetical protein [Flavobacterium selenitireducens]